MWQRLQLGRLFSGDFSSPPLAGDVHSGFYHCLQGIQGRLFELLKAVLEKGRHQTIYFGGHSLGGAQAGSFLSVLCDLRLQVSSPAGHDSPP